MTARAAAVPARVRARARGLRARIRRHDRAYYVLDRPTVSDATYDRLRRELEALEARYPALVTPRSPTQQVAGEVATGFRARRHLAPMLSLASTTDPEAVRQFDARLRRLAGDAVAYVLEPKFDGLSIEVVYRQGRLAFASTRGDGEHGEDVTANVQTIRGLPSRLRESGGRVPRLLAVRGEVLMRRTAFASLNARLERAGQPPFANPRNAAAGSVRQLDPRVTASRALDVVFYDVLAVDGGTAEGTARALGARLRAWGLPTSPDRGHGRHADDILRYHARMARVRDRLDVEIDGIVAKADRLDLRTRAGSTSSHPRWALAFKFEPRGATTRLARVEVQVGRTGVLTPVAVLRPVEVGGVVVTRATLHNWRELARKNIRVGDLVEVRRAGDVIPEIVGRVGGARLSRLARLATGAGRPRPPAKCPACRTPVVTEGPFRRCPNQAGCPAQLVRALQHFGSRRAADVDGLGARTAQQLVDLGLVKTLPDLFALTVEDLRRVPGFGRVAAAKLVSAIDRARRIDLARLLVALGLPSVGAATARRLAGRFGTLAALRRASSADLAAVPGVGPAAADAIAPALRRAGRVLDALLRHGVTIAPASRAAGAGGVGRAATGPVVVFTGTLSAMTRAAAEERVERHGGRVGREVSRGTALLVAGAGPGSKLARARSLGVPVVTEREFLRRYPAPRAR